MKLFFQYMRKAVDWKSVLWLFIATMIYPAIMSIVDRSIYCLAVSFFIMSLFFLVALCKIAWDYWK